MERVVGLLSWQMLCMDWASCPHPAAGELLKYPQSWSLEAVLAFLQSPGTQPLGGLAILSPSSPTGSDVSAWVSPALPGLARGCWECLGLGGSWDELILPRALSCALLLLLLVAVLSRGKRCSIAKILRQYRAVIFHEIQNLKNLSGSMDRSRRARLACRSDKEVAAGTLHGPEELVVWKVARNTDFVLRENCRKISKSRPRVPTRPRRGAPARRRKQLREIGRKAERLATCWEKLYALHAPRPAPRDS
ncbi:uncharacterized protein C20orf204 homolog isoform X3 [Apus apus]|uniref:uncharacterized protein C20orf204 homolog isoform X3 n=1 Tax=Apus apus TaxID=8895 RepID=UPI0021F8DAA2|nr:uncharacterized protein C20orf204 homolog isoform X3 [Apus apus]